MVHCTNRQEHSKPLVYQSLHVYQNCTNSVPIVKNSQNSTTYPEYAKPFARIPTVLPSSEWKKTCLNLFFKNNNVARGSQGVCAPKFTKRHTRVEQLSVLNKFFFKITIFCRVRHFWAPCSLRMSRKNPSSNFSNETQRPPRVKLSRTSVNQGRRIRRP